MAHETAAQPVAGGIKIREIDRIISSTSRSLPDSPLEELTLTREELQALQAIMKRDAFLKGLSDAQSGLSALNKISSLVIQGPAKLILKWNQQAFDGWRRANKNLALIGKQVSCDDLTLQISESSENQSFFERLYETRGCNE